MSTLGKNTEQKIIYMFWTSWVSGQKSHAAGGGAIIDNIIICKSKIIFDIHTHKINPDKTVKIYLQQRTTPAAGR